MNSVVARRAGELQILVVAAGFFVVALVSILLSSSDTTQQQLFAPVNEYEEDHSNSGGGGGRSMPYLIPNTAPRLNSRFTSLRSAFFHNSHAKEEAEEESGMISLQTTPNNNRRLDPFQCPPMKPPSPHYPSLPTLKQSTYAVSFPGSGDRMITKYLIESMTGLYVGEASVSPSLAKAKALKESGADNKNGQGKGQGDVVAVRTQFPHTSGKLASWDDDMTRAFVVLRSPLHAIPCYFNQLYETKSHLPTGTATLPENAKAASEAWIKWRDNQLHSQTLLYRRFISFWMEKYLGDEGNRLYFSYESFIDDDTGPQEAVRLANFLEGGLKASAMEWAMGSIEQHGQVETPDGKQLLDAKGQTLTTEESIDMAIGQSLKNMIPLEEIPCLWKSVVESTVKSSQTETEGRTLRRRLKQESLQEQPEALPPNDFSDFSFDGGEWSPAERPYTPENLASLSQMLLELMNRWSRHQRLLSILSKYHREVNRAYLELTGKLEHALDERDKLDKVPDPALAQQQQKGNGGNTNDNPQQQQAQQQPNPAKKPEPIKEIPPPPTMLPFHIIQASPPGTGSTVATNWLVGLFEPEQDVAFMDTDWPESSIRQSGREATIDSTIVTKTHSLDLLPMYKLIRPHFEEVFFIVTNRGTDPKMRIEKDLCGFKNVMCLEYEELIYNDKQELHAMVRTLTEKFRTRYEYYFGLGRNSDWLAVENELNAVERLDSMARIVLDMVDKPAEKMDLKFGVYGGYQLAGSDVGNNAVAVANNDEGHRRLSVALPGGGCEITWPQAPKEIIQTAYAASYPGCGARMSWNLIEALTGLWTGDDWDNNQRGKQVVTVKTHYPHDAGQLVPWDDEIKRALVIIRNPMNAIPSFFNHIYEIKNNLKIHSQRAPVSDWIEWRDRLAMNQITKYAKFVDYWMVRFDKLDEDRIFISYETLTDDNDGPEEAIRITNFLARSKGVNPIAVESVPCVWKATVKFKAHTPDSNQKQRRLDDGRRRLDPKHHDSQRSGPTERPYTPELLDAMSKMLLDLIERWGDRHLRLRKTLEGYQHDVHAALTVIQATHNIAAASAQQSLQQNDDNAQNPPLATATKNFHIVQASSPHSGSTVLNNLLVGMFDPDAEYKKSSIVTITHDEDLLGLYKTEKSKYDEVFFVVSNRGADPSTRFDKEVCEYNNVMCIEYEELLYSNPTELQGMVNNVADKFQSRFEYFFGSGLLGEDKRTDAVKRLEAMDNAIAAVGNEKKFEVNGKSFHIFQASPPNTPSSIVATNWLMGLFEDPDKPYSFMIFDRDQTVRNDERTVHIGEATGVTKTHVLDLMALYKRYRPQFDEMLFVVSNSPDASTDASVCEYDNVLCIAHEELQIKDNRGDIENLVKNLTDKFRIRFQYFFGANSNQFLGEDNVASAVERLEKMAQVVTALANEPTTVSDSKYGVHGGGGIQDGGITTSGAGNSGSLRGRLFYCGGAQGFLTGRKNFSYSTFGLFLAKSLFPDFEGTVEILSGNKLANSAIPFADNTKKDATQNDLLIMHSHQHCGVSLDEFPGKQLHINAEYYDLHPKHLDNIGEKLTYDYLPPSEKSFVIGPHEDTSRSIRIPFCSMRLWYLHATKRLDLNSIFDPLYKPKNTRDHFLIYTNSHYIEYREQAARALSKIGTIHTAGKCQGNFEANPAPPSDDSATKCVPFDDRQRPPKIQPISGNLGTDEQHNNIQLFSHYRYALVMENTEVTGYVSEKILSAFLSGTIPIYYGSRFVFEIFNPKAFIFFDLDIPQQALGQIQFLEQNPTEYEKMMNEPILAHGQDTIEKYFSWDETVGAGMLKSRIREMMGLG